MSPALHNKYHSTAEADAVYIGRGSEWGNPFVIGTDGERDEVVDKHRAWLLADTEKVLRVRSELAGRDLVCFCAPARCHGEVLIEVANSPVEHRVGDLLAQPDLDAIAHGVNTQGVMGAGIAKAIRNRWPSVYEPYRQRCSDGRLTPGRGFAHYTGETNPSVIYNLASQDLPGPNAQLDWLEESLRGAYSHARNRGVRSVGFPRIGAGIGGLDWDEVSDLFEKVAAEHSDVRTVIVTHPSDV